MPISTTGRPANPRPARAWIGLGSNLDDPWRRVRRAIGAIGDLVGVRVDAASDLVLTAPVGPPQPDYVNAVVRVVTELAPMPLLLALRGLERLAGRRRDVRWGARSLDLDLLMVEGLVLDDADLTLPHPQLHLRRFVLEPLCQIDPDLRHPVLDRSVARILQGLR